MNKFALTLGLLLSTVTITTQAVELEPFQPISQHSLQQQAKQNLELSLQHNEMNVTTKSQTHAFNVVFSSSKQLQTLNANKLSKLAKQGSIVIAE